MEINRTVVRVDTAKRVFQLHWADWETGEIVDLKLGRAQFLQHFADRPPCVVAMEACGGSQHWAREMRKLGHEARLLPARAVRPFAVGNKNDLRDAQAIWTAAQQPGVKTVAVKSEEQQAVLALHRMRQQLVKFRTAQINALRGLLSEYGEVMAKGRAGLGRGIAPALDRLAARLPAPLIETLREQWRRVGAPNTSEDYRPNAAAAMSIRYEGSPRRMCEAATALAATAPIQRTPRMQRKQRIQTIAGRGIEAVFLFPLALAHERGARIVQLILVGLIVPKIFCHSSPARVSQLPSSNSQALSARP